MNIALASAGTIARASSVFPNSDLHRLEHINDGKHGNGRSWISNERGQAWVELEFPSVVMIDRVIWGRDREEKYADRLPTQYRIEAAAGSNDWRLAASSADRAPYRPAQKSRLPPLPAHLSSEKRARAEQLRSEWVELDAAIKQLSRQRLVYAGTFTEKPEATYRLHRGDPMQKREAIVPGALGIVPVAFSLPSRTGFQPVPKPDDQVLSAKQSSDRQDSDSSLQTSGTPDLSSAERQPRRALARWIVDPANPLTARVIVNRLWQYHFGEGLVSTPSDFGGNGSRPTHPALLDWLASELIAPVEALNRSSLEAQGGSAAEENGAKLDFGPPASTLQRFNALTRPPFNPSTPAGRRLKHIHRLILNSATYRQKSEARQDAMAVDAGTRLLWRFPPRRLEAEPIRDAILAVSGQLDLRMGGPGFSFFEPNDNYVRVYHPKSEFAQADWRRMVYGTVVRQRPDGVFGVFDCPDAGQIAPRRTRSTTPLQALNLLNSGFIMQQAQLFAERLEHEARGDVDRQVRRAFALTFQRDPDEAEVEAGAKLVRAQGLEIFCRALFNANEFVYLQ